MSRRASLVSWLWDEWLWLPRNVSWSHLQDYKFGPESAFITSWCPTYLIPIVIAVMLMVTRVIVFTCLFRPLIHRRLMSNAFGSILRAHTGSTGSQKGSSNGGIGKWELSESQLVALAKRSDVPESTLRSSLLKKKSTIEKHCKKGSETLWETCFFSIMWTYGFWALWDKAYLWSPSLCWVGYPKHEILPEIFWYYQIETAFYVCQVFSHFTDAARHRKDFWQMLIHHIATLFLLSFSWRLNFHRIGVLILFLHDFADIFLQAAKFFKYLDFNAACEGTFAFFVVSWLVTRVFMYPLIILRSVTFELPIYVEPWPVYYFLTALLYILYCLHWLWTILIMKIALLQLAGTAPVDSRSPESSDAED